MRKENGARLDNRIDRITVRNFRSLKEVSVELDDLTVLVGPNGSGKSNFIDVLRLVRDTFRMGLRDAIAGLQSHQPHTLHFFGNGDIEIEIEISLTLNGMQGTFGFAFHLTEKNAYSLQGETYQLGSAEFVRRGDKVESSLPLSIRGQENFLSLPLFGGLEEFAPLYNFLSEMEFHAILKSEYFYPARGIGLTSANARDLVAVLASLDEKSLVEIGDYLGSVVPGISQTDTINIEKFGTSSYFVQIRHQGGDIELSQESDGTLRFIMLLTALYHRPAPSLMAIEEPELFIHPPATSYLTELIEEASIRGQVIISTHSPDFIARFPPESLRVFEIVDGATQISKLREDQMQSIKDHLFDAGELLQFEGLKRG